MENRPINRPLYLVRPLTRRAVVFKCVDTPLRTCLARLVGCRANNWLSVLRHSFSVKRLRDGQSLVYSAVIITCVHTQTHAHTHTRTHKHTHVHIHIHIHVHIRTHVHIHITLYGLSQPSVVVLTSHFTHSEFLTSDDPRDDSREDLRDLLRDDIF